MAKLEKEGLKLYEVPDTSSVAPETIKPNKNIIEINKQLTELNNEIHMILYGVLPQIEGKQNPTSTERIDYYNKFWNNRRINLSDLMTTERENSELRILVEKMKIFNDLLETIKNKSNKGFLPDRTKEYRDELNDYSFTTYRKEYSDVLKGQYTQGYFKDYAYKKTKLSVPDTESYNPYQIILGKIFPNMGISKEINSPKNDIQEDLSKIVDLKSWKSMMPGAKDIAPMMRRFYGLIYRIYEKPGKYEKMYEKGNIYRNQLFTEFKKLLNKQNKLLGLDDNKEVKTEENIIRQTTTNESDNEDDKSEISQHEEQNLQDIFNTIQNLDDYLKNLDTILDDDWKDTFANTETKEIEMSRKELQKNKTLSKLFKAERKGFFSKKGKDLYKSYLTELKNENNKNILRDFIFDLRGKITTMGGDFNDINDFEEIKSNIKRRINKLMEDEEAKENEKVKDKKSKSEKVMKDNIEGDIQQIKWGENQIVVIRKDSSGKKFETTYNKSEFDKLGLLKADNLFSQIQDSMNSRFISASMLTDDPEKIEQQINYYEGYIDMLKEYRNALRMEDSFTKRKPSKEIRETILKEYGKM